MKIRWWLLVPIFIFAAGCSLAPPDLPRVASPTLESPAPIVLPPDAPDATQAARAYLEAWQKGDFEAMYALLTPISQDAISEADFIQYYQDVEVNALLSAAKTGSKIDFEFLSSLVTPPTAQVGYRVVLNSALVDDLRRETSMKLSLEGGSWRIQWDHTLILPELAGGNRLKAVFRVPSRANINDRSGRALVAQSGAVAVGINTITLDPAQDERLIEILVDMGKGQIQAETLRAQLESYRRSGWYLPIADFATDVVAEYDAELQGIPGVVMQAFRARYYFDGGPVTVAPHVTGYMSGILEGEEEDYRSLGYGPDDRVGRDGLEKWAERYLSGQRGGTLYVVSPTGSTVTKLGERTAEASQAIYTTVEKNFQNEVQKALNGMRGAVVVMERDSGRVLAIASSPGFNPNLFEPTNYNSQLLVDTLYVEDTPLLNRAAQGQYPLGSVFKIITMAAGLESERYTPQSTYQCGYLFQEIQGVTLHDWTYEHGVAASGLLTLPQGLTRSCNPWFWHIALDLFNQGFTTTVSDMARGFGLGSRTGIEIPEAAGQIPDPVSQIDATNMAIGQGAILVSPLQVANFIAAIGNGGTLYQPSLIERIAAPDSGPTYIYTPTIRARLPVSQENLASIQEAMVAAIGPQGTARSVGAYLTSYNIPAAGKTGTAQTSTGLPHAWFAGYTFAEREGQPDIAVAVILENAGEGSVMAAPIFQGVVKLYFYGPPRNTFPWEESPGILAPKPEEVQKTPTATP